jgi:hypothetical protein
MAEPSGTGSEGEGADRSAWTSMPPELRVRLGAWIDLEEVGDQGLWSWLATVLPLLPAPRARPPDTPPADRVRALAADLIDCAGDRARLTIACEHYVRDNQLLARRVKALEAVLRTGGIARGSAEVPDDPKATAAADRYMPRRPRDR